MTEGDTNSWSSCNNLSRGFKPILPYFLLQDDDGAGAGACAACGDDVDDGGGCGDGDNDDGGLECPFMLFSR